MLSREEVRVEKVGEMTLVPICRNFLNRSNPGARYEDFERATTIACVTMDVGIL